MANTIHTLRQLCRCDGLSGCAVWVYNLSVLASDDKFLEGAKFEELTIFRPSRGLINKMSKFGISALLCAALVAVGLSVPARASTMQTYDITLTQTSGTEITGADFTVTSSPFTITVPSSGYLLDTPTVSFKIGTTTYSSVLDVAFNGPTVSSIYGYGDTVNGDTLTSLGLTSFQLYGTGIGSTIGGRVSMQLAPATTPLPAALPLFAGGLGMLGFLLRRRKRSAQSDLAAA